MHIEVLFWSLSPQAAYMTKVSVCSLRAHTRVLGFLQLGSVEETAA